MAGELGSKLNDKIGGKAGSWLAKGQQAMKVLERKKVEGFMIPSAVSRPYTFETYIPRQWSSSAMSKPVLHRSTI